MITAAELVVKPPTLTANAAEFVPVGTVTVAGTVTRFELLETATTVPKPVASRVTFSVQFAIPPEVTTAGEQLNELTPDAPTIVISDVIAEPLMVTVIFALWPAVFVAVTAANDVTFAPAAIAICAGTVTVLLSVDTDSDNPPDGAADDSVTVHVAAVPAGTYPGTQLNPLMLPVPPAPPPVPPPLPLEVVKDSETDCEDPLYMAVIFAD